MSNNMAGRTLIIALLAIAGGTLLAEQPPQSSSELPPGPMQSKATTACTECHESRIIVQQRLNKAAWTKEVDKMIKWGAFVDPTEHDALIDYFSANFPPDKPPYIAAHTARTSTKKQ